MTYMLLGLLACKGTNTGADSGLVDDSATKDTGFSDNGAYTGATYIGIDRTLAVHPDQYSPDSALTWECPGEVLRVEVFTVGWTLDGELELHGDAVEVHPITSVDHDPHGWWDRLLASLDTEASSAVMGESTAFSCDEAVDLTFLVRVFDPSGAEADCAVWGEDPVPLDPDCEVWL